MEEETIFAIDDLSDDKQEDNECIRERRQELHQDDQDRLACRNFQKHLLPGLFRDNKHHTIFQNTIG
jgi:hypothetical protein